MAQLYQLVSIEEWQALVRRLENAEAQLAALDSRQQGGAERRYEPYTNEELAELDRKHRKYTEEVRRRLDAFESGEVAAGSDPLDMWRDYGRAYTAADSARPHESLIWAMAYLKAAEVMMDKGGIYSPDPPGWAMDFANRSVKAWHDRWPQGRTE